MMLTITLILITWYTTKYYYTRSLKLSMPVQILIWFTLNVISVLKPYTLIKIFYGLPTTAWPAFNYG